MPSTQGYASKRVTTSTPSNPSTNNKHANSRVSKPSRSSTSSNQTNVSSNSTKKKSQLKRTRLVEEEGEGGGEKSETRSNRSDSDVESSSFPSFSSLSLDSTDVDDDGDSNLVAGVNSGIEEGENEGFPELNVDDEPDEDDLGDSFLNHEEKVEEQEEESSEEDDDESSGDEEENGSDQRSEEDEVITSKIQPISKQKESTANKLLRNGKILTADSSNSNSSSINSIPPIKQSSKNKKSSSIRNSSIVAPSKSNNAPTFKSIENSTNIVASNSSKRAPRAKSIQILEQNEQKEAKTNTADEKLHNSSDLSYDDMFIPSSEPQLSEDEIEDSKFRRVIIQPDERNLATLSDSEEDENEDGTEIKYKNRVGSVPLAWYANEEHIGYNAKGEKILRKGRGDSIDAFLTRLSDPSSKRTIYDPVNDESITLTKDEIHSLHRLRKGSYSHLSFDPYSDYDQEVYTSQVRHEVLGNAHEPKRRFIPSGWEAKKIVKLVKAMRNGWLKSDEDREKEEKENREKRLNPYLMWGGDGLVIRSTVDPKTGLRRMPPTLAPPKPSLPGHAYSYNPPAEYLFSPEEENAWKLSDPSDRTLNFIPQKYSSLREVPFYQQFINDRFERCLDLYLCPRTRKKKINIDPNSLIPALPKPSDLKPFPTTECLIYSGCQGRVRCISVSSNGEWMVSGSEDGCVRLWEVMTTRCFKIWRFGSDDEENKSNEADLTTAIPAVGEIVSKKKIVIEQVHFHPNPNIPLLAVCVGSHVVLLRTGLGSPIEEESIDKIMIIKETASQPLANMEEDRENNSSSLKKLEVDWKVRKERNGRIKGLKFEFVEEEEVEEETKNNEEDQAENLPVAGAKKTSQTVLTLNVHHPIKHFCWHDKGDYFATASTSIHSTQHSILYIHRLSTHSSHSPFSKSKGLVSATSFHPLQPFFILCTKQYVYIYHLVKQILVKKLLTPANYLSSLSIHPSGDHVLAGSYDRKVCWWDLDGSNTPYKTLKYHSRAVRDVAFHSNYPLFATCSDDATVHVFHATVYTDLMTNPLIVPVKILKAHDITSDGLGVLTCKWHPKQPWIFSAGADKMIKLFI